MAIAIPIGAIPLAVGTVLALGVLTLVLSPLVNDGSDKFIRPPTKSRVDGDTPIEASDSAVAALREIEFDRETGKLSDSDYLELKARYTKAALAELRVSAGPVGGSATNALHDPIEAAIGRARANQKLCVDCGPRSEPDATYCSNCGRYLPALCAQCGERMDLASSHYCSACGDELVAA